MDSSFSHNYAYKCKRRKTSSSIFDTQFENGCIVKIGFTAGNVFYSTNDLRVTSFEWIHEDKIFRVHFCCGNVNQGSITIIVKYDSFQRIDINDKHKIFDVNSDIIKADIVFVVKHNPIFKFRIWNKKMRKLEYGRCCDLDGFVGASWKDLMNATAYKITYMMDASKFHSWKSKLIYRVRCTVTTNEMIYQQYCGLLDPDMMDFFISKLPPKAEYNLECIRSRGTVGFFLLDYYLIEKNGIKMLENLITEQKWDTVIEYFALMYKFLKKDMSLTFLDFYFHSSKSYMKPHLDTQYVPIKIAYVTPTKILFGIEEYMADNRGFRIIGHEKILLIKFVDEDGSRFPPDERLLHGRIFAVMTNGISVAGKTYFDFGSSSSLFRQNGTYFCEAKSQQEIINKINELGEFKIEPSAKLSARVGLFFSTGTEIELKLQRNQIGRLEDIVTSSKDPNKPQYTFTEGIGKIDRYFAEKIRQKLGLSYTPSAFQFRCIGCKGMVAIDPYDKDLVSNGGQYLVKFRDSQSKFNAYVKDSEIDFDIVKRSGPAPLKLHQSFASLLVALAQIQGKRKIVEKRINELFNKEIVDILQTLYDPDSFAKALRKLPKHFPINIFGHHEQLIQQDFLRSIIEVNAVNLCRQLSSKCPIRIPESFGRQALGVVDEYGLLEPGEIFFQYTHDFRTKSNNPSKIIHIGRVGITKSPMYHPGDIRYLTAVDHPKFHHLVDVIVFSQRGERPIPDQIGGGDLDGDAYDIFWDPAFLMEHSEPADFFSPDSSHLQKVTVQDLHLSHASFRVDYMLNNNIDKISNCFLNHITLHPPDHPEVKKISEKADIAVNSFKSGLFAEPPEEEPLFNPNFMNKRHEPMFDSDHILSQLHKRIMRIYLMMQASQLDAQKQRREMKALENNFTTSYFARKMFKDYCSDLSDLMNKFGIKTEAELFANIILEPLGSFNTFKSKNEELRMASAQKLLSNIIRKFRKIILYRFKADWADDMTEKRKTLSTYVIPNDQITGEMRILAHEFQVLAQNSKKFLSFPYLIIEALDCSICNNDMDRSTADNIHNLVYDFLNLSYDNLSSDQNKSMMIEENLIGLSFLPSTFKKDDLLERIFTYPPFTISVPSFYSDKFQKHYEMLKKISGCLDIRIRFRKNKNSFHHYSIICEGTLKSCIKLEEKLIPYLEFDESMIVSLDEMKQRKVKQMQEIFDNIEIFGFNEVPDQIMSDILQRNESDSEERQSPHYHLFPKRENPSRKRPSPCP